MLTWGSLWHDCNAWHGSGHVMGKNTTHGHLAVDDEDIPCLALPLLQPDVVRLDLPHPIVARKWLGRLSPRSASATALVMRQARSLMQGRKAQSV